MNTAVDSILMNMLAATQSAGSVQAAKPSDSGAKDGPSFRDLLQDKRQPQEAQPADKGGTQDPGSAAQQPEEEAKLPGLEQQAIAAAVMAQHIVVVTDAQNIAETAVVPVQTAEQVLPQNQAQQAMQGAAQQTESQAQTQAAPEAAVQTAEVPKDTGRTEQNAAQPQADADIRTQAQTETVQRTPAADRQESNDNHSSELLKKNAEGMEVVVTGEAPAQPLFRSVEQAPVKVGDAQTLDTQAPDMDAKLTAKLDQALDEGARRVEITLTPENLGTVVVEMTQNSDGTLHVVLHTSNDKAANLLSEHAANLGSLLQSSNQGNVQVEVQRQQESQQGQQHNSQDGRQQGESQAQDQQQQRQRHEAAQDFLQQLRLGLVSMDA